MASDSLSQIVTEKLDKNNFQAWKFRMTNFLMGKGYWEFIIGKEVEPILPNVKIMGEKEGVSLAAFSHTQWGNTHKGGG